MSSPYLSVIVVFHSRTTYLRAALESVTKQTTTPANYEVVLVGPALPANPDEAAALQRYRFVASDSPGLGGKIVAGIENSSGEVITFLEDDDLLEAHRLERIRDAFMNDASLTYFQNGIRPIDAEGLPYPWRFPHDTALRRWRALGPFDLRAPARAGELRILAKIPAGFNTSSIALRRSIVMEALDYIERANLISDVAALYLALSQPGTLRFDPEPLTVFRIHGTSASYPVGGTTPLAMEGLRAFLADTRGGRETLLAFMRSRGNPTLVRQAEGLCAVSDALEELRSTRPDSTRLTRALLGSIGRLDTFEVRSRLGAVPLAVASILDPELGHSLYSAWWKMRNLPASMP